MRSQEIFLIHQNGDAAREDRQRKRKRGVFSQGLVGKPNKTSPVIWAVTLILLSSITLCPYPCPVPVEQGGMLSLRPFLLWASVTPLSVTLR